MGRPRKQINLVKTFLAPRVLSFEQLCGRLRCSRSTILRRLKEHGYHSSYNDTGRFLTIDDVAQFDRDGLWAFKSARFSRFGSLKNTAERFVHSSEAGMTHEELQARLGVRVHNVLLELVGENRIERERLGPTFVYLSRKRSIQQQQIGRRKVRLKQRQEARPSSRQIIATMLEVIKAPKVQRQAIVIRCQRAGVPISGELVDAIFQKYELDKKRAR